MSMMAKPVKTAEQMTIRKVALYSRVSTKSQDTDNQTLRLKSYSEARGFEVFDVYEDVASGMNAHRPQLDRMMDDARKRRFDAIICVRLDRLGRSVANLSALAEELDRIPVSLIFMDQNIDTSTSVGKLVRVMLSGIAEFERELIVERTMDGLAKANAEGRFGGRPKTTLSDYQIKKAQEILSENPNISQRKLAEQFTGINRKTLIQELRRVGVLPEKVKE